ncbi:MAG: V-type ATPase subunit [Clostridiales bacterium]|nr:V-type ATPase subunit [Clostridiales bacterium]
MEKPSYAYAVGNVRAHENGLLNQSELDSLLHSGSVRELASTLSDRGYGLSDKTDDIDRLLDEENEKLWRYLRETAPDDSLFAPFLYRNDFHNAGVILKGILVGRNYLTLLLRPTTVEPELLAQAVRERRYDLLPERMESACRRAYEVLAHTGDGQLCDVILDRGQMEAALDAAERSRCGMLCEYFRLLTAYSDIKILLRGQRTGQAAEWIREALCPVESVPAADVLPAYREGEEALLNRLERLDGGRFEKAVAAYKISPSAFERQMENELMDCARRGKRVTLGPEPLIGYLLAKEAEIRALHIVASGIRTGLPEASIRERLRELYG